MNASDPNLTIEDIRDWVGPDSFKRGEAYFFQNAIFEPRRQGATLKAQCRGRSAPAYRVQAVMDTDSIASATCSCPVGGGGHCKHVAALLLTWIEKPGAFQEIDNLNHNLAQRNKEELIAIILQMLQHHPNLAYLLEVPSLVFGSAAQTIDPEVIRGQVVHAIFASGIDWGWRDPRVIAADLEGLLQLADQYLETKDYTNAAIIYRIVAEEVMTYEDIVVQDDEGSLHWLVNECVGVLAEYLDDIQTPSDRLEILQSLLNIYLADLEMGGLSIADQVPFILYDETTPAEREQLAERIRTILPGLDGWAGNNMGGLLLGLQEETLPPEEYLDICRQTGRIEDLVDKLLALGRVEEAVCESGKASDYTLLSLARIFVRHGHEEVGEGLIMARTKDSRDSRLWEWLRDHAIAQRNLPEALTIASKLFWDRPSLEYFLVIRKIASQIDQWVNLRPEILSKLNEQKQFELLAKIYLNEEDISSALEAVEQMRAGRQFRAAYDGSIEMRIARAAEKSHPQAAIYLYLDQAEREIALRGRKKYKEAVGYLKKVRQLYEQIGNLGAWQNCITLVQQEYHMLPALLDEIKIAGL